MTHEKIIISALSLLLIAGTIYAIASQESLTERIERENRASILLCIDNASKKSSSQEILQATRLCNENIFTKVIEPKSNSWTATGASIPVPLWNNAKISVSSVKKSGWVKKTTQPKSLTLSAKVVENKIDWKTYDIAIPLIQKYEWLHLKAYPDYKGCSIGWWTRANSCKESITQSEADKRLGSIVKQLITRVSWEFPTLSSKQKAWLVSFAYNCHAGYLDVRDHWLIRHSLWCKTAWGKVLWWLVKRRTEESKLLFGNL